MPKKPSKLKKRQDRQFLNGRTNYDYLAFMDEHPAARVAEMDTVYNNESVGPFIQSFKFRCCGVAFAILHREKTVAEMTASMLLLESILGRDIFKKYVGVLLTNQSCHYTSYVFIQKLKDEEYVQSMSRCGNC